MIVCFNITNDVTSLLRPSRSNNGGYVYTLGDKKAHRLHMQKSYINAKGEKLIGALKLEIVAYIKIGTSLSKREKMKRQSMYHTKRPDIMYVLDKVLDSMSGFAFDKREQIVELDFRKQYTQAESYIRVCFTELESREI